MAFTLKGPRGRVFIRTAISFGTAMGVMAALQGHLLLAVPTALVAGSVFGAIMVLFSMRGERRLQKLGFAAASMDPRQTRKLETGQSAAEAFDAALHAVKEIRKVRSVNADPAAGIIAATAGVTWQSFGEQIRVEISRLPGRATSVFISSRPRLQTTVADSGKGVENVETFVKAFRELIPDASSTAAV